MAHRSYEDVRKDMESLIDRDYFVDNTHAMGDDYLIEVLQLCTKLESTPKVKRELRAIITAYQAISPKYYS